MNPDQTAPLSDLVPYSLLQSKLDPDPVPYFRGDYAIISRVILHLQLMQGLLSVTNESICTK